MDGKAYTEVLVYESGRYYFVKLPREGRSISVSKDDVNSESVKINEDPFYREDLRALYDDVKLRGDAALADSKVNTSAFQLEEGVGGAVDTAALLSGGGSGGGGKPMNLTVDAAKGAFAGLQVNFEKSGSNWKGKSPDGVVSVSISTSGEQVTSINGSINANDPAVMQGKAGGVIQMMMKAAPWAQGWVMQNIQALQTGAALSNTQDGVFISITPASPTNLNFVVQGV